tara:strand:+ start:1011 stop:1739 length:729 start_codon:yes stop_codon:yes gene_type:complete
MQQISIDTNFNRFNSMFSDYSATNAMVEGLVNDVIQNVVFEENVRDIPIEQKLIKITHLGNTYLKDYFGSLYSLINNRLEFAGVQHGCGEVFLVEEEKEKAKKDRQEKFESQNYEDEGQDEPIIPAVPKVVPVIEQEEQKEPEELYRIVETESYTEYYDRDLFSSKVAVSFPAKAEKSFQWVLKYCQENGYPAFTVWNGKSYYIRPKSVKEKIEKTLDKTGRGSGRYPEGASGKQVVFVVLK